MLAIDSAEIHKILTFSVTSRAAESPRFLLTASITLRLLCEFERWKNPTPVFDPLPSQAERATERGIGCLT